MSDILQRILTVKAAEVSSAKRQRSLAQVRSEAEALRDQSRDFAGALLTATRPAIIAEIKKASPSRGVLREDFSPAQIARDFADHGAHALSVLTDQQFFQGAPHYLHEARQQCALPVLRKDFMIEPFQIYESRCLGADAVLLILAALPDDGVVLELATVAQGLHMAVLLEVHNAQELERALKVPSPLIGINNRDLHTFTTSLDTTLQLLPQIPADRIVISESGIHHADQVQRLYQAGVRGFLVGEAFMKAPSPGLALASLFAASR